MANTDIIDFKEFGFDWKKYIELQKNQILDRMVNTAWRLYLEIWWKFLKDSHAQRTLPGYPVDAMKTIFSDLKDKIDIIFCVNADDIITNKTMSDWITLFNDYVEHRLLVIERSLWTKPVIVITNIDVTNMFDLVLTFERKLQKKQYRVFEKYKISGYPYNLKSMLSEDGFGSDDHIPLNKNLVLVTGATKNSGKFSTCLGQIYLDNEIWIRAWYAKFQTFPVRNLGLNHPINLAYQAANLDNDYENIIDESHKKEYNQDAVTINKDTESFDILQNFAKATVNHKNYMIKYNSSIDASINCTWMCITDENIVCKACIQEIQRRQKDYQDNWKEDLAKKCGELLELAQNFGN